MIEGFDNLVNDMMAEFGTTAYVLVTTKEEYDPETSENKVEVVPYKVKAIFFDYIDKTAGVGTEKNSLIQTGDKQVFIQPPHKTQTGIPLPHIAPNRDKLKVGEKEYKIVTIKQHNTSMTRSGCVMYEAYIRE